MSCDWTFLGDKYKHARTLWTITGIPVSVLCFEKDITEISIAARMHWASERSTTRIEDEAYCLFGIFGINMPTLYGEGRNAFYRLQEEILRTSTDTSLFAWGIWDYFTKWEKLERAVPTDPDSVRQPVANCEGSYLFASSPSKFYSSRSIVLTGADDTPASRTTSPVSPICCIRPYTTFTWLFIRLLHPQQRNLPHTPWYPHVLVAI